ncbi:MAG: EscU/YscU/HrcU family type III secretion system export apparatus switch protein [Desulfatibacillum sp.]|nr:EscU/YscU/HrcU family type III secretion system export apparatus switch protein [Desulfatibacillum sp.]
MKKFIKKAVALKYNALKDHAPRVTATGKGITAEKIIEAARKHGVPVQEDPDLVEVLSRLDLDAEIPAELYIVVAELLAFVYQANKAKMSR